MNRGGELEAFPAHAGMNRVTETMLVIASGVPRTRGDEPLWIIGVDTIKKRSPHTRG